eukprot:TRINITY_DN71343_c1_g1_i1.p1 TRINITY_DN71343_c1_g1~~TRINITY_DN71343_c1_g1_i1.p1  ORF type:complete len:729 (-),score=94.23 TRINITY_DN71343_c1_g1_i1:637-2823(-)
MYDVNVIQFNHKGKMIKRKITCPVHTHSKIRLFCKEETCFKYICQFCFEEEHKDHQVVDLTTLSEEVAEYEKKRMGNKPVHTTELKELLEELEKMNVRIKDKHKKLLSGEEKLKYQFEKRIQNMEEEVNTKKETLLKAVRELAGKLETSWEETVKEVDCVKSCFNHVKKDFGEDSVKNLFLCGGEKGKTLTEVISTEESADRARVNFKEKLAEKLKDLDKQINSYELLTALQYFNSFPPMSLSTLTTPALSRGVNTPKKFAFPTLLPNSTKAVSSQNVKANKWEKLQIQIPKTPRSVYPQLSPSFSPELDLSRQRNALEKVKVKVIEAEGSLRELTQKIEIRKKELENLERTKSEIMKANSILRMNVERQNKVFADNVETLVPGRTKEKKITPETLFIRKDEAKGVERVAKGRPAKVVKGRKKEPVSKPKSSISMKILNHKEEPTIRTNDLQKCKAQIFALKTSLAELKDFVKHTSDSAGGIMTALNVFMLSNRQLLNVPSKDEAAAQTDSYLDTPSLKKLIKDKAFTRISDTPCKMLAELDQRLAKSKEKFAELSQIIRTLRRKNTKLTSLLENTENKAKKSVSHYKDLLQTISAKVHEFQTQAKSSFEDVVQMVAGASSTILSAKSTIISRVNLEIGALKKDLVESRQKFEHSEEYKVLQAELNHKEDAIIIQSEQIKQAETQIADLEQKNQELEQKILLRCTQIFPYNLTLQRRKKRSRLKTRVK